MLLADTHFRKSSNLVWAAENVHDDHRIDWLCAIIVFLELHSTLLVASWLPIPTS